ncbi:MAG TPA: DUF1127 domain-containing protein [Alphaproteobacteria bacterium]|nr:DUF1127 domain-containing protein [Alphaproteobacteria bacterium]
MQTGNLQDILLELDCRLRPPIGAGLAETAIWLRRAATRRKLRELDARALADIGISESCRRRECAKWFWQR